MAAVVNRMGLRVRKVVQAKPQKKLKETDAIFDNRKKRGASRVSRQRQTLRLAPQTFEVIKLSRLLFEHMDHEIAIVQQNPLRRVVAFNARCWRSGRATTSS